MTKTETAELLTVIAAFDRRTLGDADVEAWHLIIADLDRDDCAEAVKHHYATRRDWLMPADVRAFAVDAARRRQGRERLARLEQQIATENPPAELHPRPVAALTAGKLVPVDDPVRQERRAMLRQAAHTRRAQVEADVAARNAHRERVEQARAELDERRTADA